MSSSVTSSRSISTGDARKKCTDICCPCQQLVMLAPGFLEAVFLDPIGVMQSSPMPSARRFPPPWTIEENNNACFIVKDATGQAFGY